MGGPGKAIYTLHELVELFLLEQIKFPNLTMKDMVVRAQEAEGYGSELAIKFNPPRKPPAFAKTQPKCKRCGAPNGLRHAAWCGS